MLTVQRKLPDWRLRTFIRSYVQRRTIASVTAAPVEPFFARLGVMFDFLFASLFDLRVRGADVPFPCFRAAIVGPHSHGRVELVAAGRIDEVAVLFHPQGFHQLFGEPTSLFADRGTEAFGVIGKTIQQLYEQLGEAEEFYQRTLILDEFLLRRLQYVPSPDRLSKALNNLILSTEPLTVKEAANQAALSVRQLERKSLEYTGLVPKRLCRIARFERALRVKSSTGAPWTTIAHDLDYYDQMHLIHDFRALAGDTPNNILRRIHSDYLIGMA